MASSIELVSLLKEQKSELQDVSKALAEGKSEKTVAALASLVLAVATGHPEVAGILSPFIEKGVSLAFANTATKRLQAEAARFAKQDEKDAFIADIAASVETLLGQALVQLVRSQHQASDRIVEALGGVRTDLQEFREEFQDRLDDNDVKVDVQRVRDGATGVRISDPAKARVWIGEQTVSGPGTVGIYVGRR